MEDDMFDFYLDGVSDFDQCVNSLVMMYGMPVSEAKSLAMGPFPVMLGATSAATDAKTHSGCHFVDLAERATVSPMTTSKSPSASPTTSVMEDYMFDFYLDGVSDFDKCVDSLVMMYSMPVSEAKSLAMGPFPAMLWAPSIAPDAMNHSGCHFVDAAERATVTPTATSKSPSTSPTTAVIDGDMMYIFLSEVLDLEECVDELVMLFGKTESEAIALAMGPLPARLSGPIPFAEIDSHLVGCLVNVILTDI